MKNFKRIILSWIAIVIFTQIIFAQETKSDAVKTGKKIMLGAGLSSYDSEGYGGNMKFDFLLTDVSSIGLRTMLSYYKRKDYKNSDPVQNGHVITCDYKPGNGFHLMLAYTFNILGKNNYESKAGMFASLGIGYASWEMSETVISGTVSDLLYYTYNRDFGNKGLSGLICLGGDYKIGPGRIFLEILVTIPVYGTYFSIYSNQKWNKNSMRFDDYKISDWYQSSSAFGINIGYLFYF